MPRSKVADSSAGAPVEPTRVKTFARFFKNYMSISAVLAAALPIPVTSFKLIPTYQAQTSVLAIYTSLFCFLLLGFIFYSRHALARLMFPEFFGFARTKVGASAFTFIYPLFRRVTRFIVTILPALLILASLSCVYLYHSELDESLARCLGVRGSSMAQNSSMPSVKDKASGLDEQRVKELKTSAEVLKQLESWQIPLGHRLMLLYLGIFIFAESAFIVMALKEYLQDLVKLSELELITGYSEERIHT
jgi:hypothetical protein